MVGNNINGYKVLALRFSFESTAQHFLYVKEHSAKNAILDKPKGKTLFVANIPPYATKNSIKHAFKDAGQIRDVIFEGNCDTFRNGYIIFQKNESISKTLRLDNLKPLSTEKHPVNTGISKWVEEYNNSIENDDKLRERIKKIVGVYDRNDSKKDQKNDDDDEGWTVVTKNSRNPGLSRKESLKHKLEDKMFKKKKQLKNFYTFQIRESKKNHIANLRKKYEEDKKRVETMKQARKFKPF